MRSSTIGFLCFGGIACSLPLVACSSAASDQIASSGEDLVVKPGDTENLARLTLALPTGTCLPGNTCGRPLGVAPNLLVDGTSVALGTAVRLMPGDHTLAANNNTTKITLTPGLIRTFVLPVAHSTCTPVALPAISPTDYGKTPAVSNVACPTGATGSNPLTLPVTKATLDYYFSVDCTNFGPYNFRDHPNCSDSYYTNSNISSIRIAGGVCTKLNTPVIEKTACIPAQVSDFSWMADTAVFGGAALTSSDQVFVPDTYKVTVGSSPPQSFTLNEDTVTNIPISLPVVGIVPPLFKTSITFADPRTLPTVGAAQITSSCAGDRSYSVSDTATGTLNLQAYADSSCVYTLAVNGVTRPLKQTAANEFTLNRVDVNDITVTREDGSTYLAKGTYELYLGGLRVAGPYNTNTGIDAFPGTYELVIKYATLEGPKTQRLTFTL